MSVTAAVEPLGEVFTRRWVVDWMLDLAGYAVEDRLFERTVVEPSCGAGAFVGPIVQRLIASCQHHGVDLREAGLALVAVDLQPASVQRTRDMVIGLLRSHGVDQDIARELATGWVRQADFLLTNQLPTADLVIGNPPYVRLEDLPEDLTVAYRSRWVTMRGRADLYVPFYERGLDLLNEGGRLAFICADRWMRNAYGRVLREVIHDRDFAVDTVIRLHDTDCFEEDVAAYPAITVMRRGEQQDGVVIEARKDFRAEHTSQLDLDAPEGQDSGPWTLARVPGWFQPVMWPEGPPTDLRRLRRYEARFEPLEDVLRHTRVGIGVATGADGVFITDDHDLAEADRMLPLVMADHIADGSLRWTERYLANPWNGSGLIDLGRYPRLAEHFDTHRDLLGGRHVAKKQPARWFKTIDRVHGWLTGTPKILLVDMKKQMTPVVDEGKYYPHHNLYWITSTTWDPYVLAGLLLSDHAELFVRSYSVKMRGGTLRMQAQYLRRIRVPHPQALTEAQADAFEEAYRTQDRALATRTAGQIYD